jgi:hypothetical protein
MFAPQFSAAGCARGPHPRANAAPPPRPRGGAHHADRGTPVVKSGIGHPARPAADAFRACSSGSPAQAGCACGARGVRRRAPERIPVAMRNLHQPRARDSKPASMGSPIIFFILISPRATSGEPTPLWTSPGGAWACSSVARQLPPGVMHGLAIRPQRRPWWRKLRGFERRKPDAAYAHAVPTWPPGG